MRPLTHSVQNLCGGYLSSEVSYAGSELVTSAIELPNVQNMHIAYQATTEKFLGS